MRRWVFVWLMSLAALAQAGDSLLGAGDVVHITVYGNPDMTTDARISDAGAVSFPLVGDVKLGGLTVPMAEHKLASLLEGGHYVRRPQVNVNVVQFVSQQVSILGEVQRPGRYPLDRASTLTDLLAMAGGIGPNGADLVTVVSPRNGKATRREYDLRNLFRQGGSPEVAVYSGDIIFVPRAPVFYIYGEVQRPGVFRLEREMIVAQALAAGGGLTARGTERGLRIKRRNARGVLETIDAEATTPLAADDVLQVQESLF